MTKNQIGWPPLPTTGFIKGRAATFDDFRSGNAVFASANGETVTGVPIDLPIPQYALFKNDAGTVVPAILLQAETSGGMPVLGLRSLDGNEIVASADDVELLGTEVPK